MLVYYSNIVDIFLKLAIKTASKILMQFFLIRLFINRAEVLLNFLF
jgi:hypothetical protein